MPSELPRPESSQNQPDTLALPGTVRNPEAVPLRNIIRDLTASQVAAIVGSIVGLFGAGIAVGHVGTKLIKDREILELVEKQNQELRTKDSAIEKAKEAQPKGESTPAV